MVTGAGNEATEATEEVYLRVDNPDSALQAALEGPLPSAASQDLSFDHQVF